MKLAIIRYNAGNIQSVAYALERLQTDFIITSDWETIKQADKVIFPGVGEASTTMDFLRAHKLDKLISDLKQPVLGICLGMQLLCKHSEENNTTCLGIFDEPVRRFIPTADKKVPHMGWNNLVNTRAWLPSSLDQAHVYFVHSYYVPVNAYTAAETHYTVPFSAALQKDNFYAVQFHPEKSGEAGERILKTFLAQ